MKLYTNQEQTTKLIELGFEKPSSIEEFLEIENDWSIGGLKQRKAYSIGELIEIMGYDLYSIHYTGLAWEVKSERVETREAELINALYNMIVKLKEEGVI